MDAASIKTQFLAAYKDATPTILHDDGLYRHIRVKGPHYYRFELVTWPGSLFVNCEGDGYTFAHAKYRSGAQAQSFGDALAWSWAHARKHRDTRAEGGEPALRRLETMLAHHIDFQRAVQRAAA